jgi:uncharacterized protein
MKIFITGSLGFVGSHLTRALLNDGHEITGVGRKSNPPNLFGHPHFTYLVADTTISGDWQDEVARHDVVINLAGKSIFTLWTKKVKKQIYDSRVLTTRNIAESLQGATETIFFSTSALGYYGDRGEDILTEAEPPGEDFLAHVCKDWEGAALKAESDRVRVVLTRFGIIMHRDGGAMASMLPAFKSFVGGRLGSGQQWFPWIHLEDLINGYRFALTQDELAGPVNWCAPEPVRNKELTEKLAAKLKRPALFTTPTFVIKKILGEFGEALLCSQRGRPQKLLEAGYEFTYPNLDGALAEIIG